jgi:hypothetical protein
MANPGAFMASPTHRVSDRLCRAVPRPCGATLQAVVALLLTAAAEAWAEGPWRADASNTAGWLSMSPTERVEHQRRMRGFRSLGECAAYQDAQHRRWREHGKRAEAPRSEVPADGCAQLRARGQLR